MASVSVTKDGGAPEPEQNGPIVLTRESTNLFKEFGSIDYDTIVKAQNKIISQQFSGDGLLAPPIDVYAVKDLVKLNGYHSSCIETKTSSTVGLGFETEETRRAQQDRLVDPQTGAAGGSFSIPTDIPDSKEDEILDPLCMESFNDLLCSCCEDFWTIGHSAIEVVRAEPRQSAPIGGLYEVPGETIKVYKEEGGKFHYVVTPLDASEELHYARYGDLDDFQKRWDSQRDGSKQSSELIFFRKPTSFSRFFGYPKYLSGLPAIEVYKMMYQHRLDFYANRGVPEFLLFLTGATVDKKTWDKIESALQAATGRGNAYRTLAANIPGEGVEVKYESLASGQNDPDDVQFKDSLALDIVSAHQVPPLLAGILIPGKLGAVNELPNSLMAFQVLVIEQAQKIFRSTLRRTLGNAKLNGGLDFDPSKDFAFRRVTDVIDPVSMDTVARMRQSVPSAQAQNRDLAAGVRD